jgi:transposase
MFATAPHLVSWAKFCPQVKQSGGRPPVPVAASRTRTFLGERYRRLAKRRGKKRALVAVGNSMLTVIWHLLSNPAEYYRDLGVDFYETHLNRQRRQRNLIAQLEQITGKKVALQPRPEQPAA